MHALLCEWIEIDVTMTKILIYSSSGYKAQTSQRVVTRYSKDLQSSFYAARSTCRSCLSGDFENVELMAAVVDEYIKRAHECQKGETKKRKSTSYYLCKLFRTTGPQDIIQIDGAAIFKVTIPDVFIGIKNLTLDNNSLRSLPESIDNLSVLRILSVKGNKLCKLPKTMTRMQHLREMNLAENMFTQFPKEILSLKLRVLDISENRIEEIPKGLSKNPFLYSLSARSNLISFLPSDLLRLVSLRFLDFDNNPFIFPEDVSSIEDRTLKSCIFEKEAFLRDNMDRLPILTRNQVSIRTKCDLCDAFIPPHYVTIHKRRKAGRVYPYGFNECRRHPKEENERVIAYFNTTNVR